jgi:predicted transcriptional regulator of viral defense system
MKKIIKKGEYLDIILRSNKTIFSIKDVAFLWSENNKEIIKKRLSKYTKGGRLIRVCRGLYAKDNNYNRLELATRINTPSYISFETVLAHNGINFQYYKEIFVASYVNREIIIDKQKYKFIHIKDFVLSNTKGIEHKDNIAIASPERAYLDRMYVSKDYYLDNKDGIDKKKVLEIMQIYNNKRLEKKIKEYFNV